MLRELAEVVHKAVQVRKERGPQQVKGIKFVRRAEVERLCSFGMCGMLAAVDDWEVLVDEQGDQTMPAEVVLTTLRPLLVRVSRAARQVIIMELTVPWEARLDEARER